MVLATIIYAFLVSYLYLFFFWLRLREDYIRQQIFTTAVYSLTGTGLGLVFSRLFLTEWWYWFAFIGSIAGLSLGIYRFKLRLLETFEAYVASNLELMSGVLIYHAVTKQSLTSATAFLVILILSILFVYLRNHYKRFQWYRSGKVGLAGLTVAGLFFLTRAAVALTSLDVLSSQGRWDAIISALLAFLAFFRLFVLAGEKT